MTRTTAALAVVLICALGIHSALAHSPKPPKSLLTRPRDLYLRFSPDGRYVLAQGGSGITVLTVQPFRVLSRISAEDANLAEFTPNSRQIVFLSSRSALSLPSSNGTAHVEQWDVANHPRSAFTEIRLHGCATNALSPDGRVLACLDSDGTLQFVDVASGQTTLERKHFGRLHVTWGTDETGMYTRRESGDVGAARIDFSPDGRFVAAVPLFGEGGPQGGADLEFPSRQSDVGEDLQLPWDDEGPHVLWDLFERKAIKPTAGLTQPYLNDHFVFVAPDRILVLHRGWHQRKPTVAAAVEDVPSGQLLLKTTILWGDLSRAANPNFVLVRPPGKRSIWAIEYGTGRAIRSNTPSLDVLGNHYVAERTNGELGLYERGKPAAVATVRLDGR